MSTLDLIALYLQLLPLFRLFFTLNKKSARSLLEATLYYSVLEVRPRLIREDFAFYVACVVPLHWHMRRAVTVAYASCRYSGLCVVPLQWPMRRAVTVKKKCFSNSLLLRYISISVLAHIFVIFYLNCDNTLTLVNS